MSDVRKVLETLDRVGRQLILLDYSPDSCIVTTKIAIEVLLAEGFDARPLAVKATVGNQRWLEWFEAGLEGDMPPGAWSVGIEHHLVAIVDGAILYDGSLDQASRPQHAMDVANAAANLGPDGVARLRAGEALMLRPPGLMLIYEVLPKAQRRWYLDSPNWNKRDARKRQQIVAAVLAVLRRET